MPDIKVDIKGDATEIAKVADGALTRFMRWFIGPRGVEEMAKSDRERVRQKALGRGDEALIKARTDGEAEIIRARLSAMAKREAVEGEIEIAELRQRADDREADTRLREQQNLEQIAEKVLPQLTAGAKPQDVDEDFMAAYREKAKLVSNEQMQSAWARLLAGEVNEPGAFSKRTINALSDLDSTDCNLFSNLMRFAVTIEGARYVLILDSELMRGAPIPIYSDVEISFPMLSHLDTIGLIKLDHVVRFYSGEMPLRLIVSYFSQTVLLEMASPLAAKHGLPIGHVLLTHVGHQLARVCTVQPVDGFLDHVIASWAERVKIVSEDDD